MKDIELYRQRLSWTQGRSIERETPISKELCIMAINRAIEAEGKDSILDLLRVLDAVYYAGQHAEKGDTE